MYTYIYIYIYINIYLQYMWHVQMYIVCGDMVAKWIAHGTLNI